jgi:hypothetical protein
LYSKIQYNTILTVSYRNTGSGSGYFSCLAACLLGERGLSHGIDVNSETVKHSEACCQRWYNNIIVRREAGEQGLPTISRYRVEWYCMVWLDVV